MTATATDNLTPGDKLANGNTVIAYHDRLHHRDNREGIVLAMNNREYVTHTTFRNEDGGLYCEWGHYFPFHAFDKAVADYIARIKEWTV